MIVRPLIKEGAKACNVTRMIFVLNDHVLDRLLGLLQEELGKAPLPFSWLLFGSAGRHELVFKSRQTNGILYGDSPDEKTAREARKYFRILSERAVKHLIACGYPSDAGDINAANMKWRQPQSVWETYFGDWCGFQDPEENLDPAIFFDFRSGAGSASLAEKLKEQVHALTRENDQFLRYLVQNCVSVEPPLSFYGNSVVEKDGQYGETLDLEGRGLAFFVDFARAMSLKYGIRKTNTLERLRSLLEKQLVPNDLGSELVEAYELLMHIKLFHQLNLMEDGRKPDNNIRPDDLSDLEKQTLKEVFEVIRRLQGLARLEFGFPKKS
jgi:CBS domain-containing protein